MHMAVSLLWWLAGCAPAEVDPCAPHGEPPATIDDVVERIDSLPSPVDLTCVVSGLPRPLPLEASSEIFSAQPATGPETPRLLMWYEDLTLTLGTDGEGVYLLELGERIADGRTVKAELPFPTTTPLEPDAAFVQVARDDGTKCGVCHGDESEVAPGRYASTPFRPDPSVVLSIDVVEELARECPSDATDPRCAMLQAVFDHGPVDHVPLPEDMPTIYDPQ
jgi:hypothetical protein